ncbi:Uncharacterised protein g9777 [Pycnogonum litorale]
MVCVSCIVIPVFIWIWYKFISPILSKIWNPWASKAVIDNKQQNTSEKEQISSCKDSVNHEPITDKDETEHEIKKVN